VRAEGERRLRVLGWKNWDRKAGGFSGSSALYEECFIEKHRQGLG
jgi:hypothetical protein